MSAYVLNQDQIEKLTIATNAILELNQRYSGSYYLGKNAIDILGKYAGDLHNLYRALFITNIKAVNGRYRENTQTLPKYRPLHKKPLNAYEVHELREIIGLFDCYLYQICEEPIADTPIYNAMQEINAGICTYYATNTITWDGEEKRA